MTFENDVIITRVICSRLPATERIGQNRSLPLPLPPSLSLSLRTVSFLTTGRKENAMVTDNLSTFYYLYPICVSYYSIPQRRTFDESNRIREIARANATATARERARAFIQHPCIPGMSYRYSSQWRTNICSCGGRAGRVARTVPRERGSRFQPS